MNTRSASSRRRLRASGFRFAGSLLIAAFACCVALQAAEPNFADLERTVLAELKDKRIPGCAIAVVSGERVVFAKGFGVANVETGESVHTNMLFRLGSTTKMFTCAAVVMLADEGKFKLDAPVGNLVKGLNTKVAALTPVQLMAHTAGLRDESPMRGLHDDSALGAGIRAWRDDIFFAEPGRIYSYANPGYWLAGLLAETVDGKPYADVLDSRLFQPLGMKHTTLRPVVAMTFPLAVGHEPADDSPVVSRPLADNAATWPAGQMFSTVGDLARWCIALMHDGKLDSKQVLAPSLIAAMTTPRADIPGGEAKYGLGLNLSTVRGVKVWQHGGSRAGYGSYIRIAPEKKFAVIALMNLSAATMPRTIEKAMETVVPVEARAAAKPKEELPLVEAEIAKLIGRYRNGASIELLSSREGQLWLRRTNGESRVVKIGENRFETRPGGTELIVVNGADGRAEFLFRGGRALRLLRP